MKFTVDWIEKKTSTKGTVYHKAVLVDESEKKFEDVAVFNGFKDEDLRPGGTLEGELTEKEYNGKSSFVLNAPAAPRPQGGAARGAAISQAQDRKERAISTAQQNKEEGIKVSSTARDATLIVTTFYPELSKKEAAEKSKMITDEWTKWRKWFMDNWDASEPF